MSIINFGSLNIDHTYSLPHFVRPGETMKADQYAVYCGGKGLNQSIAAAKAGALVRHACVAGSGSDILLDCLKCSGVDLSLMGHTDVSQGHAVIQVSDDGMNCIILCPGSNFQLTEQYVDTVLDTLDRSHYVMLQNETSNVPYIIRESARRGHRVVFNASPFEAGLREIDLRHLAWLMVNEIEGAEMSGETEPDKIIAALQAANPNMGVVLTLGSGGSICCKGGECVRQSIFEVNAVDTTGAGDTYSGYFVAALDKGLSLEETVLRATAAAAISVTRKGAGPSIPLSDEVDAFISENA